MFKLTNLTKEYDGKTILADVNYQFPEKGLVCLLGESGVGKSTLMNILAGLETDFKGTVTIGGQSLGQQTPDQLANYRKDTIGFVFQDYQLLEGYTALENVLYPMQLQEQSLETATNQALDYLNQLGLAAQVNQKVETLSGGQKQRVALARAQMNQPRVILADEPTGALDRQNTDEVLKILQQMAQSCLVVMITHDASLCQYADEVITIEEQKIIVQKTSGNRVSNSLNLLHLTNYPNVKMWPLALKQFHVTFWPYLLIAAMLAIGGICTLLTLSSNQLISDSLLIFQEKNDVLRNGSIRTKSETVDYQQLFEELLTDQRLEDVYQQTVLKDIQLTIDGQTLPLPEKFPMAKSEATFSYGVMPRKGKNEIALSGTLAKQFTPKIDTLVGKKMRIEAAGKKWTLTISGIYNAGYDDFYLSSDREQTLYPSDMNPKDVYALHFDVKNIADVPAISQMLSKKKISHQMSVEQVTTILQSFTKIKTLFWVIASLVIAVCLLLTMILLGKLQAGREQMMGLLATFGFNQKLCHRLLWFENILLASLTSSLLAVFYVILTILIKRFNWELAIGWLPFMRLLGATFLMVICIGWLINRKTFKHSTIQLLKG